ncbi:MAG TPA: YcnI family protein [Streptomyces sp.]|uniref:YcnI family copper-binding membrane protein n=1 Tax=Streptomyces sp. TaxID=1931 RepID=UPI002D62BF2D|nr:YcnI family protein [Streptomyces sp.]HZG04641.1 YcnI family protein [Streptomyces sp.]
MQFPTRFPAPSPRRLAAAGAVAAACVMALAGPAAAHVTVNPDEAEQGGYATVNVKVPNERDNASTVKLEVTFPADHPLASVMPQPVPGWDVKVTKTRLDKPLEVHGRKLDEVPSKITWTETDGGIEPGTFQQFPVSVGQLPEDVDRLVLKAVQTYSNKEVVRWIEEPVEGGEEPEHPAPVLKLVPPAEGEDGHGDGGDRAAGAADDDRDTGAAENAGSTENAGDAEDTAADAGDTSDTTARVLAVIGIAAGAGGIAFGVLAGRRRTT